MKTLKGLALEAHVKWDFWRYISDEDLAERDKTREETNALYSYFEGKFEAYSEAMRLSNEES